MNANGYELRCLIMAPTHDEVMSDAQAEATLCPLLRTLDPKAKLATEDVPEGAYTGSACAELDPGFA